MFSWRNALFGAGIILVLGSVGCGDSMTQPQTRADTGDQVVIRTKQPSASSLLPDYTDTYTDMVPYRRVRVTAFQIDQFTWRLEITVLNCQGDICFGTWFESVLTIHSPSDESVFRATVSQVLDDDGDGLWDWQERNPPVPQYQQ